MGKDEAPPAHEIFRKINAGDLVFIKSFAPSVGLTIKAIGMVKRFDITEQEELGLGFCLPVKWIWEGQEKIGKLDDKWPVRSVTLYEEQHPRIQEKIVDLFLSSLL